MKTFKVFLKEGKLNEAGDILANLKALDKNVRKIIETMKYGSLSGYSTRLENGWNNIMKASKYNNRAMIDFKDVIGTLTYLVSNNKGPASAAKTLKAKLMAAEGLGESKLNEASLKDEISGLILKLTDRDVSGNLYDIRKDLEKDPKSHKFTKDQIKTVEGAIERLASNWYLIRSKGLSRGVMKEVNAVVEAINDLRHQLTPDLQGELRLDQRLLSGLINSVNKVLDAARSGNYNILG